MKLPITDQFLLDIFNFLDETEDALRLFLHPPKHWGQFYVSTDDPIYIKYHKALKGERFKKLIYYLKRKNYIKVKNLASKKAIIIDNKGFEKIAKIQMKDPNNKIKRKDGKWTMIIFDVPEKYKTSRELLRSVLNNLGYNMFQKSVWITPYDVTEKTETLLQGYSLDKFVKIFLVEKIT